MSSLHYSELCRLCLVNERVSIPIFDGESGIQSLCLKIGTCLPIKISPEDILPKNICNECFYKVENQYQFWISTANAEKQLLQWLSNVPPISGDDKGLVALAGNQNTLKTEMEIDPSSELSKSLSQVEAVLAGDASNVPEEEDEDEEEESEEGSNSEESDDDGDNGDADDGAKDDGDTDEAYDEELEPTTFVNVSFECDEAGPSGTQQGPPTAPSTSTSAPAASGENDWQTEQRSPANNSCASPNSLPSRDTALIQIKREPIDEEDSEEIPLEVACDIKIEEPDSEDMSDNPNEFRCPDPVCCKTFWNLDQFELHVNSHSTAGKKYYFPCGICDLVFNTLPNALNHQSTVHTTLADTDSNTETPDLGLKMLYSCKICSIPFKHIMDLNMHVSTHKLRVKIVPMHSENVRSGRLKIKKTVKCDICDKVFSGNGRLNYHMISHSSDRPHKCPTCGKGFKRANEVTKHGRTHVDGKYCCNVCRETMLTPHELAMHKRTHFNIKCKVCGKTFMYKRSLVNHKNIHFRCDMCGNLFLHKSRLTRHVMAHMGMRRYRCRLCRKVCTSKTLLTAHKHRAHSGYAKPYSCDVCHKSLKTKRLLEDHIQVHSSLKTYKGAGPTSFACKVCPKVFGSKQLLIRHLNVHLNL